MAPNNHSDLSYLHAKILLLTRFALQNCLHNWHSRYGGYIIAGPDCNLHSSLIDKEVKVDQWVKLWKNYSMQCRKVGLFGIFMVLIGHFSAATLSTTTTSLGCLGVYAIFALFRTAFSCGLDWSGLASEWVHKIRLKPHATSDMYETLLPTLTHSHTHSHTQCKKVGRIGKSQTKRLLQLQLGGAACGFARRLVPLVNTQIQLNLIRLTCQRSLSVCVRVCVCDACVCAVCLAFALLFRILSGFYFICFNFQHCFLMLLLLRRLTCSPALPVQSSFSLGLIKASFPQITFAATNELKPANWVLLVSVEECVCVRESVFVSRSLCLLINKSK